MQKIIKLLRLILAIPAVAFGGFLGVLAATIWLIPLAFLEWLSSNLFGESDWSLLGLIFGKDISTFEVLYVLSSGVFISTIGLYLGISTFPYQKYRKIVAYLLSAFLLISFSSDAQLANYEGEAYLYYVKIVGIILGILYIFLLGRENKWSFDFVDKMVDKKFPKKEVVHETTEPESKSISQHTMQPLRDNSMKLLNANFLKIKDKLEKQSTEELVSRTNQLLEQSQDADTTEELDKIGIELKAIRAELDTRPEEFARLAYEDNEDELAELEDELKEVRVELKKYEHRIP